MTSHHARFLAPALLVALGTTAAGPAFAQDAVISAAKAAGTVGEQADGYIGIKGTVGADIRAAVDALNIKRRAAYTDLAAKRSGATVADVAAATGCPDAQVARCGGGRSTASRSATGK